MIGLRVAAPGVVGALLSGCLLANKIEVCERRVPEGQELNALTDGPQRVSSPRAVAAVPTGEALVVFRSGVFGAVDDERSVLRTVLVDAAGTPLPTCNATSEYTLVDVGPSDRIFHTNAEVTLPADLGDIGLVSFVRYDRTKLSMEVMGQLVSPQGCGIGSTTPFEISDEPDGSPCELGPAFHCVATPATVQVKPNRFAVFWLSGHDVSMLQGDFGIFGRVFDADYQGHRPLPTSLASNGKPARLSEPGSGPSSLAALGLGQDRIALAWQERSTGRPLRTVIRVINDRFDRLSSEIELSASTAETPELTSVALALAGNRLLVMWVQRNRTGVDAVFTRILELGADGSLTPVSVEREVDAPARGRQDRPSAVVVTGPKGPLFLVVWTEDAGDGDGRGVRAVLLDVDGNPVFNNTSCADTPFVLTSVRSGDQREPAAAVLENGTVFVVWSDEGRSMHDRSGSAVLGATYEPRTLLPFP